MEDNVPLIQNASTYSKKTIAPEIYLDYMKCQLDDFDEFGPNFTDVEDDDRLTRVDFGVAILVGAVFVLSIALLSMSIMNLIKTNAKLKILTNELDVKLEAEHSKAVNISQGLHKLSSLQSRFKPLDSMN